MKSINILRLATSAAGVLIALLLVGPWALPLAVNAWLAPVNFPAATSWSAFSIRYIESLFFVALWIVCGGSSGLLLWGGIEWKGASDE